eukprot:477276-Hanusia_phi.AAC.5
MVLDGMTDMPRYLHCDSCPAMLFWRLRSEALVLEIAHGLLLALRRRPHHGEVRAEQQDNHQVMRLPQIPCAVDEVPGICRGVRMYPTLCDDGLAVSSEELLPCCEVVQHLWEPRAGQRLCNHVPDPTLYILDDTGDSRESGSIVVSRASRFERISSQALHGTCGMRCRWELSLRSPSATA